MGSIAFPRYFSLLICRLDIIVRSISARCFVCLTPGKSTSPLLYRVWDNLCEESFEPNHVPLRSSAISFPFLFSCVSNAHNKSLPSRAPSSPSPLIRASLASYPYRRRWRTFSICVMLSYDSLVWSQNTGGEGRLRPLRDGLESRYSGYRGPSEKRFCAVVARRNGRRESQSASGPRQSASKPPPTNRALRLPRFSSSFVPLRFSVVGAFAADRGERSAPQSSSSSSSYRSSGLW